MANFESIPGISPSSVELLEAAGFLNETSLAKAGVEELVLELTRANAVLKLAETVPDRAEVESWIAACRRMTDPLAREYEAGSLVAVNYEGNEEVLAMLAQAPFALPLPARQLIEKKVAVSDIPPAILLNRVVGDLEVRVAETEVKNPAAPMEMEGLEAKPIPPKPIEPPVERLPARPSVLQRVAAAPAARLDIDVSRVKSVAEVGNGKVREPAPASENGANDRVSLIRAPRPETNAGRNPESRWFIRGVLHGHPLRMRLAALSSVILAFVLPLAIASACLLLASDLYPETFGWVPKWLLAFPLCLPVAGAGYLIWALGDGRCRVCNQLLFVPRRVNKNSKAHHFPLLGYIVPTALHLLVFRWFRCTYCGTAVRVKE